MKKASKGNDPPSDDSDSRAIAARRHQELRQAWQVIPASDYGIYHPPN